MAGTREHSTKVSVPTKTSENILTSSETTIVSKIKLFDAVSLLLVLLLGQALVCGSKNTSVSFRLD
jgi:hypothetical protein